MYSHDCLFFVVAQALFKMGKNNPVEVISRQPKIKQMVKSTFNASQTQIVKRLVLLIISTVNFT